MSIKSMTGFGRGEYKTPHGPVRIELKSTNLKFFELSSRIPDGLAPFAEKIRKVVQARVKRGKVFLAVAAPETLLVPGKLYVNEKLAREYHKAFLRLNRVLGVSEKVGVMQIARMPDVISRAVSASDIRDTWLKTEGALRRALDSFDQSRAKEGQALVRDLLKRAGQIRIRLGRIRSQVPKIVRAHRQKLEKRRKDGAGDTAERIAAENASFAKASDITEEVVRMMSHLDAFKRTLREGGEAGRKIDFICQEMIRETNTIGSKSSDFHIADHVIHIKAELEKIREQAQNIE